MYMDSIWISYVITVIIVFNADLVIGENINIPSGARFNITIELTPKDTSIFWLRGGTNLRDARVNTTTGSGCRDTSRNVSERFNFYCEDFGGTYILELNSSVDDQGIIYTTDASSENFQYEVIDESTLSTLNYTIEPNTNELKEIINISCTVTCTPQDTSITIHLKQNGSTQHPLDILTRELENCNAIGFQTITVTSNVTTQFVKLLEIKGSFTILFTISYGGEFITRETPAIKIVADTTSNSTNNTETDTDTTPTPTNTTDPTTTPIENTTVAQSSISQTSTTGANTSADASSSSSPLSSPSLPSTSQQGVTNGASTAPNTPPPESLSDEILAVIIASSVVGIIIFVATICLIVCCVVIRKRKRNPRKAQHSGDHSYSNMGYNYNGRPDTYPSESKHHSRHTPRQRPDYLRGPAVSRSQYGHYLDNQLYSNPYRNYPDYQLYNYQYKNYPSKSEYNQSSRNKSSAPNHTASSRHDPRSDKYFDRNRDFNQEYKHSSRNKSPATKHTASPRHGPRSEKYQDPNRNYNYVNQEYYIRPYAGGYPLRSGDYRYYR